MTPAERPTFADRTSADDAAGNRQLRRLRMLKRAVIGMRDEFLSQPCILRDMSETGARIEYSNISILPKNVVLHVEVDGFKIDCEVVWQKPPFAGLRFVGPREKTRLARKQVLAPAESALSDEFVRDHAYRSKLLNPQIARERELTETGSRMSKTASRPHAFGKRHFKG